MKPLIVYFWAVLALFLCLKTNGQDIIYTISGEINKQKTPLDSIAVENLTNQTHMGFGNLPECDDYRINLTRNEYWGSTSINDILKTSRLQLIKNLPGTITIGYKGQTTVNAAIALYNTKGQRLTYKENQILESGSLIEAEMGTAGIYFLTISTSYETRTFKATGILTGGNMSIATQSGTTVPLKSGHVYTLNDTGTKIGDNVKVLVFKGGYVAQPVELTVDGNETLVFPLEAQTPPEVQTLEATNILSNSATLNGNLINDGNSPITELGFFWSATNENPGETESIILVDSTIGSFSAELNVLEHATTYSVRAFAINEIGTSYGEAKSFITNAILPSVTTTAITNITQTTASGGGNITSDGGAAVTERGVCWNTTGNPTIADSKTIDSIGTDVWVSELLELQPNTTYYVRAYATNSQGTAYGEQVSFITPEAFCDALDNCNLTFTHSGNAEWYAQKAVSYYGGSAARSCSINHIQQSSMETNVKGPGILSFYWKVSSEGEIDNLKFYIESTIKDYISGNVDWQLKEYVIPEGNYTLKWQYSKDNSESHGQDCGWVDKIVFINCEPKPIVLSTTHVNYVDFTTAKSGGTVTLSVGAMVTDRGVCWNTIGNPTIADTKTSDGVGSGAFISSIVGLKDNTTYYLRAYAINSKDTVYGDQIIFTTKGTFTDSRDGTVYETNRIGNQSWMAENLRYLPSVSRPSSESYTSPCYYVYGYNGTSVSSAQATDNFKTRGVLYNWTAAITGCPAGWHLPSDKEWRTLEEYLINNGFGYEGSGNDIAKSLAAATIWASWSSDGAIGDNLSINNSSGFSALPGGCRYHDGSLMNLNSFGYWWSSSEYSSSSARFVYLPYYTSNLIQTSNSKVYGYSVRCVRN